MPPQKPGEKVLRSYSMIILSRALTGVCHYIFRCTKLLETLKKKILAVSINDVMNEELFVNLEDIRAKFKQVLRYSCCSTSQPVVLIDFLHVFAVVLLAS